MEKTIPVLIRDIQCQSKTRQPETNNIVVEIHSPRMAGVLLLLGPHSLPQALRFLPRIQHRRKVLREIPDVISAGIHAEHEMPILLRNLESKLWCVPLVSPWTIQCLFKLLDGTGSTGECNTNAGV
uniref:Uncharacterized protein n=1 Tax=Ralstonia syzygii R24 TaxID=907261 RepID=G3AAA9_9RALS|nr:hypothetical protein RALSY_mp10801 [Ralstonia syzygii R24]